MTKEERVIDWMVKKVVELHNPEMGGKWDTQMYRQKEEILEIFKETE